MNSLAAFLLTRRFINFALKSEAIRDSQTSARSVNSPTRQTIDFVIDVFKINRNVLVFVEAITAAHVEQNVTRNRGKERNGAVVIDDANAVDR